MERDGVEGAWTIGRTMLLVVLVRWRLVVLVFLVVVGKALEWAVGHRPPRTRRLLLSHQPDGIDLNTEPDAAWLEGRLCHTFTQLPVSETKESGCHFLYAVPWPRAAVPPCWSLCP